MNRRNWLLGSVAVLGVSGFWLSKAMNYGVSPKGMGGMAMGNSGMASMKMGMGDAGSRVQELPEGAPLPALARLANMSKSAGQFTATLDAGLGSHEFVQGLATSVLAYNGALPGPMIEVTEGDHLRIEFKNNVPQQPSTIHWHGLEIPANQDGNPSDPIASGSSRNYEFDIPAGSAGSYWYHPHPHGFTAEQVYRGLAGPLIVRSKADPLPAELGDTVLFISSVSLNTDGAIAENTMADSFNGREGDHVLVNGAKKPVLSLAPGSSRRFRIYNATNGRFLRLNLEGHQMTLAGTDGGLLAAPVRNLEEILLAPAERAEIVVDFQASAGTFALNAMPYERGWMGMGKPESATLPLMHFELKGAAASPIALPEKLRDIIPLGDAKATKRLSFTETMGMANGAMTMGFQIDQKTFDMNRIDLKSREGDVELWEIANTSDMDHPFHIHGTQFQIIEREKNGAKSPAPYLAWKDTVNITSKETVHIKLKHATPGIRMYHCHILEHEDAGMMGQLEVS